MKPDTFTELIRRKLESIRPDFTERDWARMQRSLHQAGLSGPPGGAGGMLTGQSWLLVAAGVGTAVLLTLAVWQRAEINDLRQKLAATAKAAPVPAKPADTVQAASQSPQSPQTRAADTVYITRYVPVQTMPATRQAATDQNRYTDTNTAENRSAETTDRSSVPGWINVPGYTSKKTPQSNNKDRNQRVATAPQKNLLTSEPDEMRMPESGVGKSSDNRGQDNRGQNAPADGPARQNAVSDRAVGPRGNDTRSTARPDRKSDVNTSVANARQTGTEAEAVEGATITNGSQQQRGAEGVLALLQPRQPGTIDWNARLARRFRRTVSVPAVSAPTQKPESQAVAHVATVFRLGVSTSLRARYWNTGLVAETVINGRWVLSAGLVRSSAVLGSFVTDEDYDYQTRRNFRREFAPGFDPKRDIYGIKVRSVRYQIPLSLGYRIPLGSSLALLPSVGAYLDLSNTMQIAFSYRRPYPRSGYDVLSFAENQPVTPLNAYTFGTALEWHQKHWVAQGGLLLARPLYSDLNGEVSSALGGRVRLLYQF